jgi:hypothetical protein
MIHSRVNLLPLSVCVPFWICCSCIVIAIVAP